MLQPHIIANTLSDYAKELHENESKPLTFVSCFERALGNFTF